ncbi:hypothetical protein K440DRAFT_646136 [Wilcoxina mikolae CBS 423.85]|nr:hypothetical protein K440DRAFT_646136 [Wilcoxina mikolae CBS 423.85]
MSSSQDYSAAIEVDPAVLANDAENSYDSSGFATSSESLSSSINEYIFENGFFLPFLHKISLTPPTGRRYHAYFGIEKSFMPTDEKEQDRSSTENTTLHPQRPAKNPRYRYWHRDLGG